jgi:GT2 family glycosyltransferase
MKKVAIIILNWNGREDTIECLTSLQDMTYPHTEIILVDNGSMDGSVQAVSARFPEVHIIETGRNLGFTGGNNVGLTYALTTDADYVMLLNNDTVLPPDFLEPLVDYAEANPRAGVVGPKIYLHATRDLVWFDRAYMDRRGTILHADYKEPDPLPNDPRPAVPTAHIPGCALLIKRKVIQQIGMLDEDFYLLCEDSDWCLKAKKAGYQVVVIPS